MIEVLKAVEPRLSNLEVLTESGIPRVLCELGEDQMIPLERAGDGLSRLFTIFAAMGVFPKGVILVDEIETGVHHTAMRRLWRM